MFDQDAAREEIGERNRLRRESSLPPVPVEAELKRVKNAFDEAEYAQFCEAGGRRSKVMSEVLAEIRHERADPKWRPGGPFNGGYFMEARVQRKLRRMYEESQRIIGTLDGWRT